MNKPYIIEIEPDQADKIMAQNLREIKEAIEHDKGLWGEDWKKDLKAVKRILKIYE